MVNKADDQQLKELLARAFAVCKRCNHPTTDPEYNSAIHLAVYDVYRRAVKKDTPARDVIRLANQAALNSCLRVRGRSARYQRRSREIAATRSVVVYPTPSHRLDDNLAECDPPRLLAPADLAILLYVQQYGRRRAAQKLGVSLGQLKHLLLDIQHTYLSPRQRAASQDPP